MSPLKMSFLLCLLVAPSTLDRDIILGSGALVLKLNSPSALAENNHYGPGAIAHMQEGVRLLRAKQSGKARSEFLAVVKMEPEVPDAYNNIGLSYAYENNPEKAISYYKKALEKDPTYSAALNNLGLLLYSTGKPAESLAYWNLCLKTSTEGQPELHYYLANALRDVGRKDEARQHYRQAIELEPSNAAAHSGLAALALSEGSLDEAFEEVTKAIKLKPDSAFSYYHLGLIQEKRGNKDEAVKAFQTSLKYETVARYAAETRSRIAKLTGQADSATASVEPAVDARVAAQNALKKRSWKEAARLLDSLTHTSAADDAIVWNNLGLCQMHLGQSARAVESYRHALMIRRQGFPEAQFNLGMALRKAGDNNGAEAAFRKAIDDSNLSKKTNPLAQNMLGIILREKGDTAGADHAFRLAIIQSGSRLPVAHFNLALLLERTEHSRDAVREYQTYLKLAPGGSNAGSARSRLKRLTGA